MSVEIRRVYDQAPSKRDEYRILVDRIWPRGFSKHSLQIDEWCQDIAPSTRLRKWFAHDTNKWVEFRKKYLLELDAHQELLQRLKNVAAQERLVLLYSARDSEHNQATILQEAIGT